MLRVATRRRLFLPSPKICCTPTSSEEKMRAVRSNTMAWSVSSSRSGRRTLPQPDFPRRSLSAQRANGNLQICALLSSCRNTIVAACWPWRRFHFRQPSPSWEPSCPQPCELAGPLTHDKVAPSEGADRNTRADCASRRARLRIFHPAADALLVWRGDGSMHRSDGGCFGLCGRAESARHRTSGTPRSITHGRGNGVSSSAPLRMAIRRPLRSEGFGTLGAGASEHAVISDRATNRHAHAQRLRVAGDARQGHGLARDAPRSRAPQPGLPFTPETSGRAWPAGVNLWIPNSIAKARRRHDLCL